jgi:hypothetical protein
MSNEETEHNVNDEIGYDATDLLRQQVTFLKQIAIALGAGSDEARGKGIVTNPATDGRVLFIYINKDVDDGHWGYLPEGESKLKVFAPNGQCLHATVLGVETYTRGYKSSKFKDQDKFVIYLEDSSRKYRIECGKTTAFAFAFTRNLLSVQSDELTIPLYITPVSTISADGSDSGTVFCDVFNRNGEKIFIKDERRLATWDADVDITCLAERLKAVNGDRMIEKFKSLTPTADHFARKEGGEVAPPPGHTAGTSDAGSLRDQTNKVINIKVKQLGWDIERTKKFISGHFESEGVTTRKEMDMKQLMRLDTLLVKAIQELI